MPEDKDERVARDSKVFLTLKEKFLQIIENEPGLTLKAVAERCKIVAESVIEQATMKERERCARVAETTKFSRICSEHGHDDGEIKWNFNGCAEIAAAIRQEPKEG